MTYVRPKKHLGQHFLVDQNIAKKIAGSLLMHHTTDLLEIGPGTGILTHLLLERHPQMKAIEVDGESVSYLKENYPQIAPNLIHDDFLKTDLRHLFPGKYAIIGNFPYNISSQIFFRVLADRNKVQEVVCMIQREVAERIRAKHGSKTYGILSVFLQCFYHIEYLFTIERTVFLPPPKVQSAVIRLTRNEREKLPCAEELFFKVVKQAFNQRRKTLRNSLKEHLSPETPTTFLSMRPEQLSVDDLILLTTQIEKTG